MNRPGFELTARGWTVAIRQSRGDVTPKPPHQLRPRHQQLHFVKKAAFASALCDQLKSNASETELPHKRSVARSRLSVVGYAYVPYGRSEQVG